MKTEELTQFHLTALLTFHGKRSLTETSLARFLRAEKAVARHALNVLTSTGMIKKIGPYEWNITPEGAALLEEKEMIKPQKKVETRGRKPTTVSESVARLATNESAALEKALNTPAAEIATEAVHSLTPAEQVPEQEPEPMPELIKEAPADFQTLVRQGLARLNAQLGLQPVVIDRLQLKIDTLGELAGVIGQVDANVEDLLLAVVKDLQRIADRTS